MGIAEVLKQGAAYTNTDAAAKEMLADFTDHKVGMVLGDTQVTLVVKDSAVAIEDGMREDCHAAMKMSVKDVCEAIDNSYDLMEIREKGELIKGDMTDPATAVHFMATFPFFDAMVRLYEDDVEFKKQVDAVKASA